MSKFKSQKNEWRFYRPRAKKSRVLPMQEKWILKQISGCLFSFFLMQAACAPMKNVHYSALYRLQEEGKNSAARTNMQEKILKGMIDLGNFHIDQYEVSQLGEENIYLSMPYQYAVHGVTYQDAQRICHLMGKRLCRYEEWLQACSGGHQWIYSYSDYYQAHACNVNGENLEAGGLRKQCKSESQVYDLIGNLSEWVGGMAKNGSGLAMGGSYLSGANTICYTSVHLSAAKQTSTLGVRCCL